MDQTEYVNLYIQKYQRLSTELMDAKLQLEIKAEILAKACNEKDAAIAEKDVTISNLETKIQSLNDELVFAEEKVAEVYKNELLAKNFTIDDLQRSLELARLKIEELETKKRK